MRIRIWYLCLFPTIIRGSITKNDKISASCNQKWQNFEIYEKIIYTHEKTSNLACGFEFHIFFCFRPKIDNLEPKTSIFWKKWNKVKLIKLKSFLYFFWVQNYCEKIECFGKILKIRYKVFWAWLIFLITLLKVF